MVGPRKPKKPNPFTVVDKPKDQGPSEKLDLIVEQDEKFIDTLVEFYNAYRTASTAVVASFKAMAAGIGTPSGMASAMMKLEILLRTTPSKIEKINLEAEESADSKGNPEPPTH